MPKTPRLVRRTANVRKMSDLHGAHDRHAGHSVAMFRDKFWLSFALTIPVVFWSADVQSGINAALALIESFAPANLSRQKHASALASLRLVSKAQRVRTKLHVCHAAVPIALILSRRSRGPLQ